MSHKEILRDVYLKIDEANKIFVCQVLQTFKGEF